MSLPDPLALIAQGGIPYSQARSQIRSGDLALLHHAFVKDWMELSWYDKQIYMVQRFTGPYAHVAVLDRIQCEDGTERVVAYESVVPRKRAVRLSTTASEGFFLLSMDKPMTPAEREAIWSEVGFGPYSKWGAILAGANALPSDEDSRDRTWCAKSVSLWRRMSGVDLGARYVPTAMALEAMNKHNARLTYVRMTQ